MSRDRHSYCRLERGGDCALRMGRVIHSGSSLAAGRARSVTGQSPLPKKRHDRQSYGGQAVGTSWIAAPNSRAFASIRGLKFSVHSWFESQSPSAAVLVTLSVSPSPNLAGRYISTTLVGGAVASGLIPEKWTVEKCSSAQVKGAEGNEEKSGQWKGNNLG